MKPPSALFALRLIATLSAVSALSVLSAGCAAPLPRPKTAAPAPPAGVDTVKPVPLSTSGTRATVGVAFGGGSAKGLAHVGVIRWFEEHRIPIDLAAGTSMGGLIGGAFATGMDADEIQKLLEAINWDEMFGSTSFPYKNIRRKDDARSYPSRLEFGVKRGIVAPPSLNDGEQVELLLARITAPSFAIEKFDQLPTPFRTVAVDLVTARQVVLDSGPLARALRATMSLPLIFPPVEVDGRVLVDGGTMNNVPADVVRAMGAGRVVAINVGDLNDREGMVYSLAGLAGATIDAMMRATTMESLKSADVVINVPLEKYGSLDWRRVDDLITEGYRAAEAMSDRLLPLAVSDADYRQWQQSRSARRLRALPSPAFVRFDGFAAADTTRLTGRFGRFVNADLDVPALERELAEIVGLDRYESVNWRLVADAGSTGLLITGRQKPYAPPFLMLGLNLENTTSSDFQITATARYLTYGLITSNSETRIDGTLGSNPAARVALYQPIASSPAFVSTQAGVFTSTARSITDDDRTIAEYGLTTLRLGLDAGANLGRISDVRVGAYLGHAEAELEVGDPNLPELAGRETGAILRWRFDSQDSAVVPSLGLVASARLERVFNGPDGVSGDESILLDARVTQFEITGNQFWSLGDRNRTFVAGGLGTSFNGTALPTNLYTVGGPFRLGAYRPGVLRGQNYYSATGGYLRQVGRLPDFLGGALFAGAWLDNGDAFDDWALAKWRSNPGFGMIMDTLLGPVIIAGSAGFDGRWRTYVGVGRIFR